jgi:adenine phosphoribosyltransferase
MGSSFFYSIRKGKRMTTTLAEADCFRVVTRADGTTFYDFAPLLADPWACKKITSLLKFDLKESRPTLILALETRGYLLGAWLSFELHLPLVLLRKTASALKAHTEAELVTKTFDLEYKKGESISLPIGCIPSGARVLLVDDVLATGGTLRAAYDLVHDVEPTAEVVGAAVILDLRKRLSVAPLRLPFEEVVSVFD